MRRKRFNWLTLDDVAFSLPSTQHGPERNAELQEQRTSVQQALQKLPESYRLVTVLRYWHDLSYQEIAEATGLTESTIKTRLHRARHMMAELLRTQGVDIWESKQSVS